MRQTPRAVTPFGGLSVFIQFLTQIGFREQVRRDLPVHLESPNAINPGETFTAFPGEGRSRTEESRIAELERKVGRQAMEILAATGSVSRSSGAKR